MSVFFNTRNYSERTGMMVQKWLAPQMMAQNKIGHGRSG